VLIRADRQTVRGGGRRARKLDRIAPSVQDDPDGPARDGHPQPVVLHRRTDAHATLELDLQLGRSAALEREDGDGAGPDLDRRGVGPARAMKPRPECDLAPVPTVRPNHAAERDEEVVAERLEALFDVLVRQRPQRPADTPRVKGQLGHARRPQPVEEHQRGVRGMRRGREQPAATDDEVDRWASPQLVAGGGEPIDADRLGDRCLDRGRGQT
jgi:hypothetical protein